jgi:hypothetical protein
MEVAPCPLSAASAGSEVWDDPGYGNQMRPLARQPFRARTTEELMALLSAVATAILAVIIISMLYFGRDIRGAADGFQSPGDRILDRPTGGRTAVDLPNVLDKALITAGDANEGYGVTEVGRAAQDLFKQPCTKRVEFTHIGHVDLQFLGPLDARRDEMDQPFQGGRMDNCPGAAWTKYQRLVLGCRTQRGYRLQYSCPSRMLRLGRYSPVIHFEKEQEKLWMRISQTCSV